MLTTNAGCSGVFEELTASLFQAARAQIIIDRCAEVVWPLLVDLSYSALKLWNPEIGSVKHISGEPGQENELVLVTKDKAIAFATGAEQPPFYMRTIRLVPNQQRAMRVDAVDGSFMAFIDHSLYELTGKRTRLVYNGYIETRRIPLHTIKAFDSKVAEAQMTDYLNKGYKLLKQAVEERTSPN